MPELYTLSATINYSDDTTREVIVYGPKDPQPKAQIVIAMDQFFDTYGMSSIIFTIARS